MSDMLAEALPDVAMDREKLARDLITISVWGLVKIMRASQQLAGNLDAVAEANEALELADCAYRLRPLN